MEDNIEIYRLNDNSVICLNPNQYPKITVMEYVPEGDGLKHIIYKGVIKIIDEKVELDYKLSYISFIPMSSIEEYKIHKLQDYEILKYKKND